MTNDPVTEPVSRSTFTKEIADVICERISDGESLRSICEDDGMPDKATVFRWPSADADFRDQYAHEREAQAVFDDMLSLF